MGLIRFKISNFRGVVELQAAPNGKSVTLKGRNGAGKSAAIDALWWALGGSLDGEVVTNGAERAEVELVIDGYLVRRQQARGKKPTLTVKSADGKATFSSPTQLLAGFVAAIERRTFSSRSPKEQAETLRALAPGLDCGDLDAERQRVYEERTGVNRDAKTLRAQAEGVVVPPDVPFPGEERPVEDVIDLSAVAAKKADAATQKAGNDRAREGARRAREDARRGREEHAAALRAVEAARAALREAERQAEIIDGDARRKEAIAEQAEANAAALVDPDTSAIDAELAAAREKNAAAKAAAREHNAAVRAAVARHDEHIRRAAERERLVLAANAKDAEAKKLTARIEQLDTERASRIAGAKLPINGIALADGVVTFNDGTHGPVAVAALNTASRIRLDVAIAAALGHRLVAVRDASLLDAASRAALDAFAAEKGVQLIAEVVADGAPLEAVIEEGSVPTSPAADEPDLFT